MWKIFDYFMPNYRINLNNTRSGNYFDSSYHRLSLTQNQSISYQAPSNWRKIPESVKNATSLNTFKKRYKNLLLTSYDNNR